MKKSLFVFACLLSTSAFAKSIECVDVMEKSPIATGVKIEADIRSSEELTNVRFTILADHNEYGYEKSTKAKENYEPRKYKNTNLFEFDLKDEDGKVFAPVNECYFTLNLPKNLENLKAGTELKFAPLLIHCDQSGGLDPVSCKIK